jgi:2Fe-2S ferredoxin
MVKITYLDQDGTSTVIEADEGSNLMEVAVRNGVRTIEGECGGALACATCHVHIPEEWRSITGEPSDDEREMLEFGIGVDERSRLGCQIAVTAAMEGLVVLTPSSQR